MAMPVGLSLCALVDDMLPIAHSQTAIQAAPPLAIFSCAHMNTRCSGLVVNGRTSPFFGLRYEACLVFKHSQMYMIGLIT